MMPPIRRFVAHKTMPSTLVLLLPVRPLVSVL